MSSVRYRPLARGEACLACKNRKIRCPAERPACSNCSANSRPCIYRRPASVISLSQSPHHLPSAYYPDPYAAAPVYHPGPANSAPPIVNGPTGHVDPTNDVLSNFQYLMSPGPAPAVIPPPAPAYHSGHNVTPPFPTPSTGPLPTPPNNVQPAQFDPSAWESSFPSVFLFGEGDAFGGQTLPTTFDYLDLSWLDDTMNNSSDPITSDSNSTSQSSIPSDPPSSSQPPVEPSPAHMQRINPFTEEGYTERVNSNAPAPTPPPTVPITVAEQEHLLWLYFTNQRIFGLEMHVATFYTNLKSPNPEQHPHPCLLNAMYLVACRASPSASLRSREHSFFQSAHMALTHAISTQRLFDAVRAGTLMTTWLFSVGWLPAANAMLGQIAHLALACGMPHIWSSRLPTRPRPLRSFRRHESCFLPPPTTQIELGERIYAFWALFLVDVSSATVLQWPMILEIDRTYTPLPRPWSEYENPDEHLDKCDETLEDLFTDWMPTCNKEHSTDFARLIKAVVLNHKASLVGIKRPNRPHRSRSSSAFASESPEGGPALPPSPLSDLEMKKSLEKRVVRRALEKYNKCLPDELKTVQGGPEKSISGRAATLLFITGTAEAYLVDNDDYKQNDELMVPIRKMMGVLRLLGDSDLGDFSIFVVEIWVMIACVIARESIRLERAGEVFSSASLDAEFDYILSALRKRGDRLLIASIEADKLEAAKKDHDSDIDEEEWERENGAAPVDRGWRA